MREVVILSVHRREALPPSRRTRCRRRVSSAQTSASDQQSIQEASTESNDARSLCLGVTALLVSPRRIAKADALVKLATPLKFHQAWWIGNTACPFPLAEPLQSRS
jgi:hypothetical protein